MTRLSCIALGLAVFVGCCHRTPLEEAMEALKIPTFKVAIDNATDRELDDVTCKYPGGDGSCGILGPRANKLGDSNLPTGGPVIVEWSDSGKRYRAEVPLRPEYIVRPQGILLIRIRPDDTISIRGIRVIDYLQPEWFAEGDMFTAVQGK